MCFCISRDKESFNPAYGYGTPAPNEEKSSAALVKAMANLKIGTEVVASPQKMAERIRGILQDAQYQKEDEQVGAFEKMLLEREDEVGENTITYLGAEKAVEALFQLYKESPAHFAEAVFTLFKAGLSSHERRLLRAFLEATFPKSREYITYEHLITPLDATKEKVSRLQQRFIRIEGLKIVVKDQQKRGVIKWPLSICASYDEFKTLVLKKVQQKAFPHLFLTYNSCRVYSITINSRHVTPWVLLRGTPASNNRPRLIATDSVAFAPEDHIVLDMHTWNKEGPMRTMRCMEKRQRDKHNCAVFALHDVMQFQKYEKLLSSLPHQQLYELPIDFWLPTQSLQQINQVLAGSKDVIRRINELMLQVVEQEKLIQAIEKQEKVIKKANAALWRLLPNYALPPTGWLNTMHQWKAALIELNTQLSYPLNNKKLPIVEKITKLKKELEPNLAKLDQMPHLAPSAAEVAAFSKQLEPYTERREVRGDDGLMTLTEQNVFAERQGDQYEGLIWRHLILQV